MADEQPWLRTLVNGVTIQQAAAGQKPLAIKAAASNNTPTDHLLEITPNVTAWGGTPLYVQNDGALVTPSYITMNSGGWNGNSYAQPAGIHSYLLALCNDLAAGQPNILSQITRGAGAPGQHHLLCQDGAGNPAFLLSGGDDNPFLGSGNLTPVLWFSQGGGTGFDTWLTREVTAGQVAASGLSIIPASGASGVLYLGNADSAHRHSIKYDPGSGGLFIRDEFHGATAITIGAAASGSIGFFGGGGAVQPVAGIGTNFTANAGTAMNSASTSTGGTGASAYTFPDVVRALKNIGLLAA